MSDDNDDFTIGLDQHDYHPDQLMPLPVPHNNIIMRGSGEVGDLPATVVPDKMTVMAFALDDRQRQMLAAGGHLSFTAYQTPIPPVAALVEMPFCPACKAELTFGGPQDIFCETSGCALEGVRFTDFGDVFPNAPEDEDPEAAEEQVREDFSPQPDPESEPDAPDFG